MIFRRTTFNEWLRRYWVQTLRIFSQHLSSHLLHHTPWLTVLNILCILPMQFFIHIIYNYNSKYTFLIYNVFRYIFQNLSIDLPSIVSWVICFSPVISVPPPGHTSLSVSGTPWLAGCSNLTCSASLVPTGPGLHSEIQKILESMKDVAEGVEEKWRENDNTSNETENLILKN